MNYPSPYIVLAGRILFSIIFLMAAPGDFKGTTVAYAAHQGVPLPAIAVPLAGIISIVGALSVLLGYKARLGAWLLVLFLIPVTLMMHNFWSVSDPATAQAQQVNFLKNISMLGGALLIAYFGSGPLSVDAVKPPSVRRSQRA